MLKDLLLKNRSYRRFHQYMTIDASILKELIELARITPSARNAQPLKYIISTKEETNEKIFRNLTWAMDLKDWDGPEEGEKPPAYIIILGDTSISKNFFADHGIVSLAILLGAVEKGLGGCIFASINRKQLTIDLNIPEKFEILYVIALGRPKEKVVLEKIGKDGDHKYWRDENNIHHVPKRSVDDLIFKVY